MIFHSFLKIIAQYPEEVRSGVKPGPTLFFVAVFLTLFIFLIISTPTRGSEVTVPEVLKHLQSTFSQIKDYKVRLHVEVDMEKVNVPEMDVIVYFKQPNKTHLQSKGFSMLPRQGLFFNPNQFNREDYYMSYLGKDTFNKIAVYKIELVPRKDEIKIRKLLMWIDPKRWITLKIHTVSWQGQSAEVEFDYSLFQDRYWLPVQAIATINLKGFRGFSKFHNGHGSEKGGGAESAGKKGRITIQFTDYEINTGLSDFIFETRDVVID